MTTLLKRLNKKSKETGDMFYSKEEVIQVVNEWLYPRLVEIGASLQKYIAKNTDGSIGEHPNKTFLRTESMVKKLMGELETISVTTK